MLEHRFSRVAMRWIPEGGSRARGRPRNTEAYIRKELSNNNISRDEGKELIALAPVATILPSKLDTRTALPFAVVLLW